MGRSRPPGKGGSLVVAGRRNPRLASERYIAVRWVFIIEIWYYRLGAFTSAFCAIVATWKCAGDPP